MNPREMGLKLEWPNKLPLTDGEVDATQKMFDSGVISKSEFARRMGDVDYEAQLEQMKTDDEMRVEILGEPEPEPITPKNQQQNQNQDENEDEPNAEEIVKIARDIIHYANGNGIVR
jgi:hypothetical protein